MTDVRVIDFEGVILNLQRQLSPLVEEHFDGACECGDIVEGQPPYINVCDTITHAMYDLKHGLVTTEDLPATPEALKVFLDLHPDALGWGEGLNGATLIEAVADAIQQELSMRISDWVEGCFVAKVFEAATELIGQRVTAAQEAWAAARAATDAAHAADKAVEEALNGKKILLTGHATGHIAGGTVHPTQRHFEGERATVTAVFYYLNRAYRRREDKLRVRLVDGTEWELPVTGTKAVVAPAQAV